MDGEGITDHMLTGRLRIGAYDGLHGGQNILLGASGPGVGSHQLSRHYIAAEHEGTGAVARVFTRMPLHVSGNQGQAGGGCAPGPEPPARSSMTIVRSPCVARSGACRES
jgi:hypothetical protein